MVDVKKLGGLLGLMTGAAAVTPDEAEAARPKYMEELVEKLKSGDYTPMDFGNISGGQLKKLQRVDPAFTEGPLKLSGKNIEKFARKRMGLDHIEPETLVDGLNSVFHGSRSRAFPDGRGAAKLFTPDGEYAWRGVVAPHDEFSGLVTGYRYPIEDMKKELSLPSEGRPLPSYPHIPEEIASKEGTLPGRLTTVEDKEKLFDDSNIPAIETMRKGMLPLFAAGGTAAALAPGEAQAAQKGESGDGAPWRNVMDEIMRGLGLGTRNVMEGLGDVADTFLNQPINAVGRLFGYDPGLVNPGKGIADAMGLPVPVTDLEKNMALWESGAASALPMIMGGGAVAKMAASPVARGVGRERSATPRRDIVISGLLSRFPGGD